jgi:ATP-binding cassette subfamily B protein
MEAQALESLALNGGLSVLVALLELLFAASLLAHGAGGSWQLGALAAWLLLTLVLTARYVRRLRVWTLQRLALTHEMVEGMVGHRTRLAQEPAGRREAHDDALLRDYTEASQAMDRALLPTAALLPRGWLLLGLASLAPALVQGGSSAAALGVALGGVLLAQRALGGISGGLAALSRAAVAWQQVAPIFAARDPLADAAPRHFLGAVRPSTSASHPASATITSPRTPLVDASGLRFRHAGQAQDVVQGLDLRIDAGERILVQGPSGGGKSTLASLLVGLRRPQSGLLLLQGLDSHTLGAGWRQWVTEAPQFHDNHILSGTLAFNLLLGRDWPASADDLQEAAQLCDELGLGPLLARMPSGLMQRVGETGWQLSHGERSRIFLARALLQRAPLTVLDESFGALDPETLTQCLRCALQRCSTLLVIAHP